MLYPARIQTNTDASILVYKFRPEKTGFNIYGEYTQLQLLSLDYNLVQTYQTWEKK